MVEKMSRWGVGPVFVVLSVGYGMIMLAVSIHFQPLFRIPYVPYSLLQVAGGVLFLIGIPFFITSVRSVMKAYNADALVTTGVYGCCRHPLYAAWVVFLVPGIVLFVNSWLGLTTPLFMYLILRILVRKEEVYLEQVFGSGYREYQKKIPCIIPYGFLKRF